MGEVVVSDVRDMIPTEKLGEVLIFPGYKTSGASVDANVRYKFTREEQDKLRTQLEAGAQKVLKGDTVFAVRASDGQPGIMAFVPPESPSFRKNNDNVEIARQISRGLLGEGF